MIFHPVLYHKRAVTGDWFLLIAPTDAIITLTEGSICDLSKLILYESCPQLFKVRNKYMVNDVKGESAIVYLNEGNQLKDAGFYDQALECYGKALAIDPENAEIHNQQAEVYCLQGKAEEAIACCQKALTIQPNYAVAYKTLGNAFLAGGKLEEARESYAKAVEIQPDYAAVLANLGSIYAQEQNWQQAIFYYQKAIAILPNFAGFYRNLARVFSQIGQPGEATECGYLALMLEPDRATAEEFLNLGNALLGQGKQERAVICYRRAIKQNSNFSEAYYSLGEALAAVGKWDEAIALYPKLIEVDGDSHQVYLNWGDALAQQGKLDEAVNCYQKAEEALTSDSTAIERDLKLASFLKSEFNPDLSKAQEEVGNLFQGQSRFREALFYYRRAFQLNPDTTNVQHGLWVALTHTQKWEEAVVWYRQAIEIKPEISWLHYHLGLALMGLQNWEEAATSFRRATELTPESFWPQQLLGQSLEKKGCDEEAILAYQQAIKLQPDATNTYLSLGRLLTTQGRANDAILVYRQVLQIQPDNLESSCKLTWLLSQQNQWNEAIKCYQKACEITPKISDLDPVSKIFQETTEYNFININGLTENERIYIENAGLSLEYLELISKDNQDWKVAMKAVSPVYGGLPKLPAFQHRILDTGYIDSVCPISGNILRSNQSFLMGQNFYIIFYRFMGAEVFYLMVASNYTYKLAIYLPSREMILVFYDEECGLGSERMSPRWLIEQHVNTLKSYTIGFLNDVKSYILNNQPKPVTAALGFYNNIGHLIWNEVSGLQDIYKAGKFGKLEALAVGGYNYGLDLQHIFPEMERENPNLLTFNAPGKLPHLGFETGIKNNLFIFTPAYYGITEELGSRLYNNSYNQCCQEILQEVGESKKHFPLLWITLRSHHRAWVSQVEGIARLIEKLSQEYCDLGVVFDGVPAEKGNMDKIISLIPPTVKTYNALDCNIYETMVWAHAPDLFVAPYGAGGIFLSIANKRGIYHTNKEWSQAEPFCLVPRENCTLAVTVPRDAVVDEMDAVYHCDWMRNYNCDWQAIYKEVVKIIEELKN